MHRFLTILILITAICTNAAIAQTDIPLFDNLQSDDTERDDSRSQFLRSESENQVGGALRALERYYNAGKYPEALRLSHYISDSLRLNRNETEQFLRYTIASYKEMQYDEQADSAMMVFTHKYPFYDTTSYDPVPFREVFSNYNIIPRVAFYWTGVLFGKPIVKIDSIFPCADTTKYVPRYDGEKSKGMTFGVQFGLTKKLSLATGVGYSIIGFDRTEDHGATKFYYNETNLFFNIPITFFYDLPQWTTPIRNVVIVPSVLVGCSANIMAKSEYKAYNWFGDNVKYTISDKEANLDDKIRVNYSVFAGVRSVLAEWGRVSLFLEGSFHYMFRELNNPKNRYNNSDLVFNNLFVPDAVHIFLPQFKFGVKYNLVYKTIPKYGYGYKN